MAMKILITIMLIAAPTSSCDNSKCKEGQTRELSHRENTFEVCQKGKWVQYTNPDKPNHRTDV